MKILFIGNMESNTGPSNVNRELVHHWPQHDKVINVYDRNRIVEMAKGISHGLICDVVISTEGSWADIVIHAVLSFFKKPVVSFLHGYLPFENEIDALGCSQLKVDRFIHHLRTSDALVGNSKFQLDYVTEALDDYSGVSAYVDLGITPFRVVPSAAGQMAHPVVAVSGGNRPIKGNVAVAKAVRELRDAGTPCELVVYGELNPNHPELLDVGNDIGAKFLGQVSHSIFLDSLKQTSVFVMNSLHDSFGLSAIDAVSSGASVLLSKNCGVCDAFDLQECDTIQDRDDVGEIKDKVAYLIDHPNAERLGNSIDFERYSWERASVKLRETCAIVAGRA